MNKNEVQTSDIPKALIAKEIKNWQQNPYLLANYPEEIIDCALDMFYTSTQLGYCTFNKKGLYIDKKELGRLISNTLYKLTRRAQYDAHIGKKTYTYSNDSYSIQTVNQFDSFERLFIEEDEDGKTIKNMYPNLINDQKTEENVDYIDRVFFIGGRVDESVRRYIAWLLDGATPTSALKSLGKTSFDYWIEKYNVIIKNRLEDYKLINI